MKANYSSSSILELCSFFGISRQAYYQYTKERFSSLFTEDIIIEEVKAIRKRHHRLGTRKLYVILQDLLSSLRIKIGRDALFSLLSRNDLLIRKRKRRVKTTNSHHWLRKHPNLIRGFAPTGINQLWVSDITYWKTSSNAYFYLSFITDVYSHKIVGYALSQSLEASACIRALKMALSALGGAESHSQLIHHSDRGVQYCSHGYTKLLIEKDIRISMTENGDPLENAVAERVNGIIKEEYLDQYQNSSLKQAHERLSLAVALYNNERPHMSIGNSTPNNVHYSESKEKKERLWRNYYKNSIESVNSI